MSDEFACAYHTAYLDGREGMHVSDEDRPIFDLVQVVGSPSRLPQDVQNFDWHHPIDRSWGRVPGLGRPADQDHLPWKCYTVEIDRGSHKYRSPTAAHYYHYWQAYHLYYLRRFTQGLYRDGAPILPHRQLADGNAEALLPVFDAVSYFQYMYQPRLYHLTEALEPDDDGKVWYDEVGQEEIRQVAQQFATETLELYHLDEDTLYEGLRGMMYLHRDYEQAERMRLAETLRHDIWRLVELTAYAYGSETEEIACRAGPVGAYFEDHLSILFPNRRKEARDKAIRILGSLALEHNQRAPAFAMPQEETAKLLDFIETTDLSIFEYILVQLNEAHFATHSWQEAEAFLALKSLATFPESLVRTLIFATKDVEMIAKLSEGGQPAFYNLFRIVLAKSHRHVWKKYEHVNQGLQRPLTIDAFRDAPQALVLPIAAAKTDAAYLGTSLALAHVVRNFTAHFVVDTPHLLRGQYVRCARAILTASFLAWHVLAEKRAGCEKPADQDQR
jgi:hypothetical protein